MTCGNDGDGEQVRQALQQYWQGKAKTELAKAKVLLDYTIHIDSALSSVASSRMRLI